MSCDVVFTGLACAWRVYPAVAQWTVDVDDSRKKTVESDRQSELRGGIRRAADDAGEHGRGAGGAVVRHAHVFSWNWRVDGRRRPAVRRPRQSAAMRPIDLDNRRETRRGAWRGAVSRVRFDGRSTAYRRSLRPCSDVTTGRWPAGCSNTGLFIYIAQS